MFYHTFFLNNAEANALPVADVEARFLTEQDIDILPESVDESHLLNTMRLAAFDHADTTPTSKYPEGIVMSTVVVVVLDASTVMSSD